jgi:hypothetical protein
MNYYIGWDVGGWNCDRNRTSRDALCVLTGDLDNLNLAGSPWRRNLRSALVAQDGVLPAVLEKVGIELREGDNVTWAIDTPLGWPKAFRQLICPNGDTVDVPQEADGNPYLFRQTELWLFRHGFRPLSAVRDMIGSQSTKGIHFLRRCGFNCENVGIWRANGHTTIETYPTPVQESPRSQAALARLQVGLLQQAAAAGVNALSDVEDSLWCALVAVMFALDRESLCAPGANVPADEGWIWIPKDCIAPENA